MKKEIRVLVVEPMRKPYVKTIPDTLEAIYQVIEGDCMQVVPLYGMNIKNAVIVCNDDGKLMGLPLNRALRDENGEMYDAVAGTFLVVGLGEEDFASLTPEMAQKYEQLFHQPEAFLKLGNRLLVLPVPDEPPAEKSRTKPTAEHDR